MNWNVVHLYHTLPSWLSSCSSVSRDVSFMCSCKYKHKLLLVTTPWFSGWFSELGDRQPLAQVQEGKCSLSLGGLNPACVRGSGLCWESSSPRWNPSRGEGCDSVPSVTRAAAHLDRDRTPLCSTSLANLWVLKPRVLIYVLFGFISLLQGWTWVFPFAVV